jgi:hypothetical protein
MMLDMKFPHSPLYLIKIYRIPSMHFVVLRQDNNKMDERKT